MSRASALKVLAYAMTGEEGGDNCSKFVDILGLRSVFPLFMKVSSVRNKIYGWEILNIDSGYKASKLLPLIDYSLLFWNYFGKTN